MILFKVFKNEFLKKSHISISSFIRRAYSIRSLFYNSRLLSVFRGLKMAPRVYTTPSLSLVSVCEIEDSTDLVLIVSYSSATFRHRSMHDLLLDERGAAFIAVHPPLIREKFHLCATLRTLLYYKCGFSYIRWPKASVKHLYRSERFIST